MRKYNAIIPSQEVPTNIRQTAPSTDWVFTDSNYFFDHNVTEKIIDFYQKNSPLSDEICAYGDFLQPLGYKADDLYTGYCKNVVSISTNLVNVRRKMYSLLKDYPLDVIALKQSKFYHIGTLREYVENFCENDSLASELGLSKFCFSACVEPDTPITQGCVIHSLISAECNFAQRTVVEYCDFTGAVTIKEDCVISNCVYAGTRPITIPANTFLQTVPVMSPTGTKRYVTLLFSMNDDMKAKCGSFDSLGEISYFDRSLLSATETDPTDLFALGTPFSLWHARLFPLSDSPEASLLQALSTLKRLTTPRKRCQEEMIPDPEVSGESSRSASRSCSRSTSPSLDYLNNSPTHCSFNCGQANGQADFVNKDAWKHVNGNDTARVLYSFADVIKFKDAPRMIHERNGLSTRIRTVLGDVEADQ